jgi:hypothetical protein
VQACVRGGGLSANLLGLEAGPPHPSLPPQPLLTSAALPAAQARGRARCLTGAWC